MPTIQPTFLIGEESLLGIASGVLKRTGGVIRETTTGKIVEHLKDTMTKDVIESTQPVIEVAKNVDLNIAKDTYKSLGAKFAVGSLIVAGFAAVGYGTYKLVTHLKKQNKEKESKAIITQSSELVMYNPGLTEYLNNMQSKKMSLSSIKKVVDFFETYRNGDLSIEITEEEMKVLRNIIVRYTIELCKSNKKSVEDKQLAIEVKSTNTNDLVYEILYATNLQKEIFAAN